MKKTLTISIVLLVLANSIFSQNCKTTLPNFEFQKLKSQITLQKPENNMLNYAKQTIGNYCFTCAQVKEVLALFSSDYYRLDYAMSVYANVSDKENFYDVYDSFAYFSNVFRLHDYVNQSKGVHPNNNTKKDPHVVEEIVFPKYEYPSIDTYNGKTNCSLPLPDTDFMSRIQIIAREKKDQTKSALLSQFVKDNCVTTAQVMKLASMLSLETSRMTFAKEALTYVYDMGNYKQIGQVFSTMPYKKEIWNFIDNKQNNQQDNSQNDVIENNTKPCEVAAQDFELIKSYIVNTSFESAKVNAAKQQLKSRNCFSVAQISDILAIFTFDDSKLEVAKFGYDYCNQQNEYLKISDTFSFSTSKDAFINFLKGKK